MAEECNQVKDSRFIVSFANFVGANNSPLIFANILGFLLLLLLMYPDDWRREIKFVFSCFSSLPIIIGVYNLGVETDGDRRVISFALSALLVGFLGILGVFYLH